MKNDTGRSVVAKLIIKTESISRNRHNNGIKHEKQQCGTRLTEKLVEQAQKKARFGA